MDTLKTIETISELRNTIGQTNGQIIMLLGYYESGDKNPLNYKWSNIQDVDDGGSIINAGNGSWIALFKDKITAKDYGAHHNDFLKIKLENASKKARDLKILLDLDVDLSLNESVNIYSDIISSNQSKVVNTSNTTFILSDNSIKKIKGISIIGNLASHANNAPVALQVLSTLSNLQNVTISECYFKNCRVRLNNQDYSNTFKNIEVTKNIIEADFSLLPIGNVQNDVITIHGSEYVQITKNKITTKGVNRVCKLQVDANNFSLNTSKVIISDNYIDSLGTSDPVLGQSKQIFDLYNLSRDIIFKNNFIKCINHTAVLEDKTLDSLTWDKTYIIDGNIISSDVDVISIRSNAGRDGKTSEQVGKTFVKLVNNVFSKTGYNSNEQGFVEVSFVDDLTVVGNSFISRNTNTSGSGVYALYVRNVAYSTIVDNYFENFTLYFVLVSAYLSVNYIENINSVNISNNKFTSIYGSINHISLALSGSHNLVYENVNIFSNVGSWDNNTNYRFLRIANCVIQDLKIINNYINSSVAGFTNLGNNITKSLIFGNTWTTQDQISLPSATESLSGVVKKSLSVQNISTPDASDLATALILINELKERLNAKLTADRNSGQQA